MIRGFVEDTGDAISWSNRIGKPFVLNEGWNWISSYIEVDDPVAVLQILEAALGENGMVIRNADYTTSYEDEEWFGDLDDEGIMNEQMYKILVSADCTIELQGVPANPENHPITINHGWNWIGVPCAQEVSLEDALANFEAAEGDILKTNDFTTTFENGEWFCDLEDMNPGQGFMYYSSSVTPKTLIFQNGAKARRAYINFGRINKQPIEVVPTEDKPSH
jgi:hypothetical protein